MTKRKEPPSPPRRSPERAARSVDPEVERLLRERAERLAERSFVESSEDVHVAVIVATRGPSHLGFPIESIHEARTVRVARLPLAPPRIAGLIAVRGHILTLLDPITDDGAPLAHGATTPVIVVTNGDRVSAVRVDAIVGPRSVSTRELDERPRERRDSIASGVTRDGLELIDVERLLAVADPKSGGAA